jgi:segregation and condensation protein A
MCVGTGCPLDGEFNSLDRACINHSIEFPETNDPLYNVKLEMFEGPLDLLLYLIKKNELDIYDIPIALITKQYIEYIKIMKELNLEVAGDFLVMASTLIQIKSSMLLPVHDDGSAEEREGNDPRAELIRRLLEYSRYKDAALILNERKILGRELFARTYEIPEFALEFQPDESLEIEIFELVEAFRNILSKAPRASFHEVSAESISISERINEILSMLLIKEIISFEDLFKDCSDREYIVATFLALLELCKLKLIRIRQIALFGSIWIVPSVTESSGDSLLEDAIDTVAT